MASVSQRLAKLEDRIGTAADPARVIFLSGGQGTEAECDAVLDASGIVTTPHDVVFITTYQQKPGSTEPPSPLRITGASTIDGRPLVGWLK